MDVDSKFHFKLHYRKGRGDKSIAHYKQVVIITSPERLRRIVQNDHVCAEYKDGHRSKEDFIYSDCLPMDCDNTPAEKNDPDIPSVQWKTPDDVRKAFPNVMFYAVTSRNHMREKDGRSPRPRHHYYFPIDEATNAVKYAAMKETLYKIFPAFDKSALDAARFFFGTEDPEVEFYDGEINLTEFLRTIDIPIQDSETIQPLTAPCVKQESLKSKSQKNIIPQGERNAVLSRKAGQLLKKYGDTEKARQAFDDWSAKCQPPLDAEELNTIYKSAQGFLHSKLETHPDYVAPDEYTAQNWKAGLFYDNKGKLMASIRNLEMILTYDDRVTAFAYNELAGHIEKTGLLPWAAKGAAWNDRDDAQLRSWLAHNYTSWRREWDSNPRPRSREASA